MTRRRKAPPSSLELLLDTICNTFGGVLFMAILVAVLLHLSGKALPSTQAENLSAVELAVLQKDVTQAQAQLESLQAAAAQQSRLHLQFARPENVGLIADVKVLEASRDRLAAERSTLLGSIASIETRLEETAGQLDELDASLAGAQEQAIHAQEALDSEIASRSQAARLPRLRPTARLEVGLVVRFGRLYVWHTYDAAGTRTGLNTDEFVVVAENPNYSETMPKPYAGVPIDGGEPSKAAMRNRLSLFHSGRHYIAVVIWEDSFDSFVHLKNELIGLGFEYRLMPIAEGGLGVFDRGGSGGVVQ
ncbi:MAG: hypothetical protein WD847_19840 [Pirellulales bacterium]